MANHWHFVLRPNQDGEMNKLRLGLILTVTTWPDRLESHRRSAFKAILREVGIRCTIQQDA